MLKKILVAPLDWGLGHTTRCIPVINALLQLNHTVLIAASGPHLSLLKAEFPGLTFLSLKGYNIQYTTSKRFFVVKILLQLPKIASKIRNEKKWLDKIITEHHIDVVISDNRYGLHSTKITSLFITHQLHILSGIKWMDLFIQKINYSYINKFNTCLIPDFEGSNNIAGMLSHPKKLPDIPVKYIGVLSRFGESVNNVFKYKFAFILSGPEPQRSLLEEKILQLMPSLSTEILILRGLPDDAQNSTQTQQSNCTIINHLSTKEMADAIAQSEFIISRTGYTTVMEMLSMQKKCILIPTPGQTEQEYLARHLMHQNWCYCFEQNADFLYHITKAQEFNFMMPVFEKSKLTNTLQKLLE